MQTIKLNTCWLTLPENRRIEVLNQMAGLTGLSTASIEKGGWEPLTLNASLPCRENIVLKRGTFLSGNSGIDFKTW